jgi:hypothetical protein
MRFASDQPHQTTAAPTQLQGDFGGIARLKVFHASSVLRRKTPSILFSCNQSLLPAGVLAFFPKTPKELIPRTLR